MTEIYLFKSVEAACSNSFLMFITVTCIKWLYFFRQKKKASNMADIECYILRIWVLTLARACMSNNLLNLSPYYSYHIPKVYLVENISFSGVRKLIH